MVLLWLPNQYLNKQWFSMDPIAIRNTTHWFYCGVHSNTLKQIIVLQCFYKHVNADVNVNVDVDVNPARVLLDRNRHPSSETSWVLLGSLGFSRVLVGFSWVLVGFKALDIGIRKQKQWFCTGFQCNT